MKNSNITKNRTGVGLLLMLAAAMIGLAPALSSSVRAGSGSYSINDVAGNYVDQVDGWLIPQGNNAAHYTPLMGVGLVTFTPATGTFHADWLLRHDAENHEQVEDNGTYTVDANGHGTMSFLAGHQRDFYIVNGGAQLKWTNRDGPDAFPPVAASIGTLTRQ
jgi:hypothetical protein